jgi:hypothetical protein
MNNTYIINTFYTIIYSILNKIKKVIKLPSSPAVKYHLSRDRELNPFFYIKINNYKLKKF